MAGKKKLSLVEIAKIPDPDLRRDAMLERLDECRAIALGRKRVHNVGRGVEPLIAPDPDVTAAIQADREACVLLRVQPIQKTNTPALDVFEPQPLKAVK